jgi:hypothetical protein
MTDILTELRAWLVAPGGERELDACLSRAAEEIERLEGRVAELSRALHGCRALWNGTPNALGCRRALGEKITCPMGLEGSPDVCSAGYCDTCVTR